MSKKTDTELQIKEGASGAFYVKQGNETLGGFRQRKHAELFLNALKSESATSNKANPNQLSLI